MPEGVGHIGLMEYPLDSRNEVLFDDVINEPRAVQKKVANHYTDGRQHNISPIYTPNLTMTCQVKLGRIAATLFSTHPPLRDTTI